MFDKSISIFRGYLVSIQSMLQCIRNSKPLLRRRGMLYEYTPAKVHARDCAIAIAMRFVNIVEQIR